MIKGSRIPIGNRVAGRTFFLLVVCSHKLAPMDVFMALVTERGRLAEMGRGSGLGADRNRRSCLDSGSGKWTMAANASRCLMRSLQCKTCGAVVERAQRFPLRGTVTRLAVFARIMRIHVTSCAVLRGKVILSCGHRDRALQRLMTVGADNSNVRARQDELGPLMLGQREGRWMERTLCMTGLALIRKRLSGELCSVWIAMAALASGRC
jgi:hypothetical protein